MVDHTLIHDLVTAEVDAEEPAAAPTPALDEHTIQGLLQGRLDPVLPGPVRLGPPREFAPLDSSSRNQPNKYRAPKKVDGFVPRGDPKALPVPKDPYARAALAIGPGDVPKLKGQIEIVPTKAELEDDTHVCTGGAKCRTKTGHKSMKPGHAMGTYKRHFSVGWRADLEKEVGHGGEELWRILANIARGRPTEVEARDGRKLQIVPAASDQVRAAVELSHMLVGKPVTQAEILASQKASSDLAAVQGLSEDDLKRRVAKILLEQSETAEFEEVPESKDTKR